VIVFIFTGFGQRLSNYSIFQPMAVEFFKISAKRAVMISSYRNLVINLGWGC